MYIATLRSRKRKNFKKSQWSWTKEDNEKVGRTYEIKRTTNKKHNKQKKKTLKWRVGWSKRKENFEVT